MKSTKIMTSMAALTGVALALSGCSVPYGSEIVENTEITVAFNAGFFHFNIDSSAGVNTANGNVKYLTDAHFGYYDDSPTWVRATDFATYEVTSEDPLTVRYEIRAAAVWSDGVEIDGADMLLAWAAISGNTSGKFAPASTSGYELITKTPEIGKKTITLVYDEPFVDWELVTPLSVSAHGTYALAYPEKYSAVQAAYDAYTASGDEEDLTAYQDAAKAFAKDAKAAVVKAIQDDDAEVLGALAEAWIAGYAYTTLPESPAAALTSGAYVIEEIKEDQYITLKANPLYTWGPSPKFERITIRTIDDSTTALQALQSGEIDIWSGQPTSDTLTLAQSFDGVTIIESTEASYEHIDLVFNNGGPFDPTRYGGDAEKARLVREAFLKTVPRQQILDTLIKPLAPDAELRDSFLTSPVDPRYSKIVAENGSAAYQEVDIEGAKELLAKAGVAAPVQIRFWYPEGNARRAQEFQLIAASAALAGFELVDTSEPNWAFTDPAAEPVNPHDATVFAWQSRSLSVAGLVQIYKSYTDSVEKGGNYNGYTNPEVDTLFAKLAVTSNADNQTEILQEIDTLLWADGYGVTLYQFPGLLVHSADVTGVKASALAPNYFWNFWEWAPVS